MIRPEQDPWDLLQDARNRIIIIERYYNELSIAHNNLVSHCQRIETDLALALESIQTLQLSHIQVLNHLENT